MSNAAIRLVDTHCHIHFDNYGLDAGEVIARGRQAGVDRFVCVGCTLADSKKAAVFAAERDSCRASIGLHPHEAKHYVDDSQKLSEFAALAALDSVVAVGECGLDYYYSHSPKEAQEKILRFQIELALTHDLTMIFHVREAFGDFWRIFDDYRGVRGIVHSFSSHRRDLDAVLSRDLFVGLNGIMTFTRDPSQLAAARAVPLDKLVLETDAPFLTPAPWRGNICELKHVRVTAEFLASLRGETLQQLAAATTINACKLFKF